MDRVSVRVETKVRKKVKQWAAREGLPAAELYRRIFEWGADQYSRVGDLERLRKMAAR
jgi:predicted DNA binding CopG/RHH family protein